MSTEWRIWSILCVLMLFVASFIQTKLFLSPDVGYLLHIANQLLDGGNYVSDFFETNPPMILYLYLPACLLSKYFFLKAVTAVRFYIFLLILGSTGLSFYFLKQVIKEQDRWFLYFLTFMMFFVLFLLPMFELGQREHVFLILTFPYYFSVVLILEKKSLQRGSAILIGILAGLGIALKPFFLAPFCLIEIYLMIQRRSLYSWIRVEVLLILSVLFIYLLLAYAFHESYFHTILPLVFHFYFSGVTDSWMDLITNPLFCFCLISLFSYLMVFNKIPYRTLNSILAVALTGMIIAFLIPRTNWYYHLLPALSMAYLLMASCVSLMIFSNGDITRRDVMVFIVCAAFLFTFPVIASLKSFERFNTHWHPDEMKLAKVLGAETGMHSIYCVTTLGTSDCFPLVYDSNSQFAGRFPFFWWYNGLKKAKHSQDVAKEKKFLVDAFADDLNRYQARWVIVNRYSFKDWPKESVKLASDNTLYRDAWKHYHYAMTIDHYDIYTRD